MSSAAGSVPDRVGVVVGWRAWRSEQDTDGVRLVSVTASAVWPAREPLEAVCRHAHAVPAPGCSCGLYAAKSLEQLRALTYHEAAGTVIGEVKLWGRVIEGEYGYRAQYGYPGRVYVSFEDWPVIVQLRECYGVPARLMNRFTGTTC